MSITQAANAPAVDPREGAGVSAPLGIYVHIPFCSAICHYCNFNRGLLDEPLKRRYVDAVCREIARAADGAPADTVYFGGGTPSLLDPSAIAAIVDACRGAFALRADAEITLEANPETASVERLEAFRRAGVTRVSFGVQSFDDRELAQLGRVHSAARAEAAVREARSAGVDNISLDLMLWLPGQRVAGALASVDRLIAIGPEHASLYLLELYPNAPLRDAMARSGSSLAPDDEAADMYLAAMERLEASGYRQYEISNVARPGFESRHNLKYWTDGEWLAFGCGAHGTRNGVRWRNVSSTTEYVERIEGGASPVAERRVLSAEDRLAEALMMGIRLTGGIDLGALRARYGVDVAARYRDRLADPIEAGLLVHRDDRLALTRRGLLVSNAIASLFLPD